MGEAFTMRFRPEIAAFVQAQASAGNRSVADFVEALLVREKARLEDSARQLTVQSAPELLRHERHDLVRDEGESDGDHAARGALFAALLDRAREG